MLTHSRVGSTPKVDPVRPGRGPGNSGAGGQQAALPEALLSMDAEHSEVCKHDLHKPSASW